MFRFHGRARLGCTGTKISCREHFFKCCSLSARRDKLHSDNVMVITATAQIFSLGTQGSKYNHLVHHPCISCQHRSVASGDGVIINSAGRYGNRRALPRATHSRFQRSLWSKPGLDDAFPPLVYVTYSLEVLIFISAHAVLRCFIISAGFPFFLASPFAIPVCARTTSDAVFSTSEWEKLTKSGPAWWEVDVE